MKIFLPLAVLTLMAGACQYVNRGLGLKDDNLMEEIVEQQIENQIGIDIDLTPDSAE